MIVLSANNITKSYGVTEIISGVSFHINDGERVGLVGVNGAGKTTLLNILSGDLTHDGGDFFVSEHCNVGYLKQNSAFDSSKTLHEEMLSIFSHLIQMEKDMLDMSHKISELSEKGQDVHQLLHDYDDLNETFKNKGGFTYKSEVVGILNSMGFGSDYLNKPVAILSGGEKTRLSLAALLLKKPDLLLLDEPTNHLDIDTLRWLEQYLKSYEGAIMLISHDRYFLDQTVNKIFEMENRKLSIYTGNYTQYVEKKKQAGDSAQKQYEAQQKEIAKQEEIIRRFKQHGTEKLVKRAQSREKMLGHMEVIDKPAAVLGKIKINFKQAIQSGNDALHVEGLSKSFGSRTLFRNVSFDVKREEKISLVGPNGVGKTTLLKMILSMIPIEAGMIKPGFHVNFGYYDQGQEMLNPSNTVLNEMHSDYHLYDERELRSILGRFLFRGDDVFKPVSGLSGGEKARLSLLKLMLSGANFLIMDEPTNHLDIQSKEIFEDALIDFPGTVLFVSHDRYFLNKVSSKTLELSADSMKEYLGNYDYYLEKRSALSSLSGFASAETKLDSGSEGKKQFLKNKENVSAVRSKKREAEKAEENIAKWEGVIANIENEMCKEEVFSDYEKTAALQTELVAAKESLEYEYVTWTTALEWLEENS